MPIFSERLAGIYRCRFTGTRDVEFTDKDTGELVVRWDWRFQEVADPTTVGEISRLTARTLSKQSNAYKFWTGLKGSPVVAGDDSDALIGTLCDVMYGPNQAGNLSITAVVRVNDPAAPTLVVPAGMDAVAVPTPPATEDELPF